MQAREEAVERTRRRAADTDALQVVDAAVDGQMKRSEAGTQRTGQPRCAQRVEIATQRLNSVGGVVSIDGLRARM